jgi:hypothetical protein
MDTYKEIKRYVYLGRYYRQRLIWINLIIPWFKPIGRTEYNIVYDDDEECNYSITTNIIYLVQPNKSARSKK